MQGERLDQQELEAATTAGALDIPGRLKDEATSSSAVKTKRTKRRDRNARKPKWKRPAIVLACLAALFTAGVSSVSIRSLYTGLSASQQLAGRQTEARSLGIALSIEDLEPSAGDPAEEAGLLLRETRLRFDDISLRGVTRALESNGAIKLDSEQTAYMAALDSLTTKTWLDTSTIDWRTWDPFGDDLQFLRSGIGSKLVQAESHFLANEPTEGLAALETASRLARLIGSNSMLPQWSASLHNAVTQACMDILRESSPDPDVFSEIVRIGADNAYDIDVRTYFETNVLAAVRLARDPASYPQIMVDFGLRQNEPRGITLNRLWPVFMDPNSLYDGVRAAEANESAVLDFAIKGAKLLAQDDLSPIQRAAEAQALDRIFGPESSRVNVFVNAFMPRMVSIVDYDTMLSRYSLINQYALARFEEHRLGEEMDFSTPPIDPYSGFPLRVLTWPTGEFLVISGGQNGRLDSLYTLPDSPRAPRMAHGSDDHMTFFDPNPSQPNAP
jgi:hypothetical protein